MPKTLRAAVTWTRVLLILSLCGGLTVLADALLRPHTDLPSSAALVRPLALDAPCLHPPGSPERHPEMRHPAVPLRHGPGCPALPGEDSHDSGKTP